MESWKSKIKDSISYKVVLSELLLFARRSQEKINYMTKNVMKIHGSHIQFSIENAPDSQIKNWSFLIARKKIIQQNQTIVGNNHWKWKKKDKKDSGK